MNINYLAAILLLASGLAWGETIEVLGQALRFTNPSGYCTVGNTQRERDLMAMSKRAVGPSSRIVHAAIRCAELEAFKTGARDEFDHWLQIQLIGPKGEFKRIEIGREAYLAGFAKVAPRLDSAAMQQRINAAFAETGLSLSKAQIQPLGRDGNAAYFSSQMILTLGTSQRPVTGLSGMTLVNALPLAINVYEGSGNKASRERLQMTLQQLMLSVLTEN